MEKKPVLGFIGIGVMGESMVRNLIKAGYRMLISTRTKQKAEALIQEGAEWYDEVKDVAANADVIITMVGYPKDVEEVYIGENGLLEHARAHSILIDMTTSSPALAEEIYQHALSKQLYALDAPVSGGDVGAKEGKLSIMVGGELEVFENVQPIFEVIGQNIVLQGPAGAGQHTKMCNQIAIASNMIGVSEAIVYAEKAGLNPTTVLESIEFGAAGSWSLSNLAPRMISNRFEPGFYVKHFIKDMTIALESAKQMGMLTPGLELSKKLYEDLAERGEEDSGTQALVKLFREAK
ncbi:NAD(P)-dependent oxidoreductase [Pseudalkalibacillus hwajinpoensis]|uniref:NAD(P)-dependent oxidoreductase n=1 Tax=Guptibacillus hwajinpoensis TaxID=208199 RepID=UPI001CD440CF|nr:NAD(P)-dependent oxidoreductase [Pseudalkalibacillus hwajinpoensis]MCA0991080.1 NAD(P)-dependent oxidoreductase [Pseudalkalibacillus hwajinpoensis]